MKKLKPILSFIIVMMFSGCSESSYKKYIPLSAGANSSELEKVFRHYREVDIDSSKFNAAVFLIENMEDKFSYHGSEMNYFFKYVEEISASCTSSSAFQDSINSFRSLHDPIVGMPDTIFDTRHISADYLIKNIDNAFNVYRKADWSKSISFSDFCEYVLPYRIGNEPLEEFKPQSLKKFKYSDSIAALSITETANYLLQQTSAKGIPILFGFPEFKGDFPPSLLQKIKGGSCVESSNLAISTMRSFGLPVAQDFTPQWPHRAGRHFWCALMLNNDSCVDFEGSNSPKIGGHLLLKSSSNKVAKVYRRTFSKQSSGLAMLHGGEEIPELFHDPYFKDVSAYYFNGATVHIDVPKESTSANKYAYLCVFDNRTWVPVAWGEIIKGKVTFPEMGRSVVYLPVVYSNKEYIPIANPVLVDSSGRSINIIPDDTKRQHLELTRKYPVFDWWDSRTLSMKGGRLQAADNPAFNNAVDVYKIIETPELRYNNIDVHISRRFKYWRYLSADSSYGEISELEFYDNKNNKLEGLIIGSKPSEQKNDKAFAFDGNPLTFFQGYNTNDNWVGIAFNVATQIKKIRFLPRNDDNFINSGNQYQLYFWRNNKWNSLGSKMGDSTQVLKYVDIPTGALFLLKNHTRGKEERIFTYENGKQIWW